MSSSSAVTKRLRIGILGACAIGPWAIIGPANTPALKSRVEVIAVAARDLKKAQNYAQKNKIPKFYNSYDKLIQDAEVDIVYIGLPNSHHKEWAVKSLHQGKHVICEKPMASNASEVQEIIDAMNQVNKTRKEEGQLPPLLIIEAFHYRYHPLMDRVKQLITEEMGGPQNLTEVNAEFCIPIISGSDIRYNYALAGGAMMDTGTYCINVIRNVTERSDFTVKSALCNQAYPNVDQTTSAVLQAGDLKATMKTSLYQFIPAISLQIKDKNGTQISVTNWVAPQVLYNSVTLTNKKGSKTEYISKERSTYEMQLDAFVEAVEKSDFSKIRSSCEDALPNQQLIDEIYQKMNMPVRATTTSTTKE